MGFNSRFKGLNAELNPICHLLALLGAHHILHVSGVRVNHRIPPTFIEMVIRLLGQPRWCKYRAIVRGTFVPCQVS